MLGLVGDQSFVTGFTSLAPHISFYVIERKAFDTEVNSAPKVDDPVRWFVERAIGARHVQGTGLDKDVALEHGSLDEPGFM
jgi:hypothetical protein